MKNSLIALIGSIAMFTASSAIAATPYFLIRGGVTTSETEQKNIDPDDQELPKIDYNNIALDLGLGMVFTKNLRADITFGARAGDKVEEDEYMLLSHSHHENEVTIKMVMLNVYYDFNFGSRFVPFIGAGIGHANTELKVKSTLDDHVLNDGKFDDDAMAYSFTGGFSYQSSRESAWDFSYSYVNYGEIEYEMQKFESSGGEIFIGYRHTF